MSKWWEWQNENFEYLRSSQLKNGSIWRLSQLLEKKQKFWIPLEVFIQKWVHLAAVAAFGNKPKITDFEAIIAIISSYKALRPPKNSILNYCKGPNDTQATLPYWCCQSWPYQSPKEISIGSSVPQKQLKFIPNMHLNPFVGQLFPPKTWFIALQGYR